MHGPIGFEPYWLVVQGYAGQNLLKLIADACFKREIKVCAITSETDQTNQDGTIPRGSVHDRLGYLERFDLRELSKKYDSDKFGENSIVVASNGKAVYLINGQTVIVHEDGRRFNHLVVGSNEVPNFMDFHDTISYCNGHGLLHGLQGPALESHFGAGLERAAELVEECDFVEGHDAQLRWPREFSGFPMIGRFTKTANDKAKEFARKHNKSYLSNSNAHRIKDAGIASNDFYDRTLSFDSEEALLSSLREGVRSSRFVTHEGYESMFGWIDWVSKFKSGIRDEKYKDK